MKGSLHFSSVLGQGTTASVRLPLELRDPDAAPEVRSKYSKRPNRRVLSAELSKLFSPLSRQNSSRGGDKDGDDSPEDDEGDGGISSKLEAVQLARERAGSNDSQRTNGASSSSPAGEDDRGHGTPRPEGAPLPDPDSSTAPSGSNASTRVRVLVVDDNSIARRILATFLKTKDVPYAEAKDGVEAVRQFESFQPNLVWCDVQMPVMDGIEATRRMREVEQDQQRPKARIVAISGLSSDLGSHATLLESGQVDEWLTKVSSNSRTGAPLSLERCRR
jgi:CheY-like chemotaxis protein